MLSYVLSSGSDNPKLEDFCTSTSTGFMTNGHTTSAPDFSQRRGNSNSVKANIAAVTICSEYVTWLIDSSYPSVCETENVSLMQGLTNSRFSTKILSKTGDRF